MLGETVLQIVVATAGRAETEGVIDVQVARRSSAGHTPSLPPMTLAGFRAPPSTDKAEDMLAPPPPLSPFRC